MERAQQQNLDGIGTKTNAVADRETPLLKSHWYVAAFSEEVTREPMRRTILDQDIVFYRTEAGTAVAVQNRCPHRSFPLHLGTLDGDRIVCGYHGIEFNPDGSCASVPALNIAPRSICLDAYALVEEGPLLWIWMGGDTEPDYSRLFQQEWSSSEAWAYEKGYMYMEASYLGLHENLMDLTHFPFLHGKWNLARPEHAMARPNIEVGDASVLQMERHDNVDVPPSLIEASGLQGPFSREAHHLVRTPGMHEGKQVTIDSSEVAKKDIQHIIHIMTPETKTVTHYFWIVAYDAAILEKAPQFSQELQFVAAGAFHEDKVALESIEQLVARDHRPGFREKILKTDAGGMQVLRLVARWAAEEQT